MKRQVWLTTLIGLLAIGCGDDAASSTDTDTDTDGTSTGETMPSTTMTTMTTTGEPTTGPTTTDPTSSSTDPTIDPDSSSSSGDPTDPASSSSTGDDTSNGEPVDFIVTIENISDTAFVPTPFSPGVWANHDATVEPIFSSNAAASPGLEELAEDGGAATLASELEATSAFSSGSFDTPVDGKGPGPIGPGESYEFEFTAEAGSRLSLATMFVASNDVWLGTGPLGVSLFVGNGDPIDREITNSLALYDAGTEATQPPGGGGYQPPSAESVPEAGAVSMRNESTRSIPASRRLIDVDVDLEAGTTNYTITFTNISDETGGLLTPLSRIAWATHTDMISVVTPGGSADDLPGLEALAEDGNPAGLVATFGSSDEVDQSGALGEGLIAPGESVSLTITPTADARFLSFATMVVDSNDAFIAPGPEGIPLLQEDGSAVSAAMLTNEIVDLLAVWDAGTEANETPGVGANQPLQGGGDVGADDEDATIRLYRDNTNDLADIASNLVVSVTSNEVVPEIFTISITQNFSDELGAMTDNSAFLTPMVWGLSDGSVPFFTIGEAASPGLEELAEDGMAAGFDQELEDGGADSHAIVTPAGPVFTIVVTASADASIFNIASMIVPSNDTFLSLGADGVDLFNGGTVITAEEAEAAIIAALGVYDAGTEQNQAGMSGRDMAGPGLQAAGNTGADEGSGLIRNVTAGASGVLNNEPVWSYGDPEQLIRVTVSPAR